QVFAAEGDAAAGYRVMRIAAEYARQRTFAGTVRAHDGVHFTGFDVQVQAFDDFLAVAFVSGDGGVQVGNFQHVQFPVFSSFSPWERGGRLTHRAFEAEFQQFLRFHRKLHRQLIEHFLAEAVDERGDGLFGVDAAAAQIKQVVFADARGAGLVFDDGTGLARFDIREGVRAALRADQQRITL